jgi:hypothetical protein
MQGRNDCIYKIAQLYTAKQIYETDLRSQNDFYFENLLDILILDYSSFALLDKRVFYNRKLYSVDTVNTAVNLTALSKLTSIKSKRNINCMGQWRNVSRYHDSNASNLPIAEGRKYKCRNQITVYSCTLRNKLRRIFTFGCCILLRIYPTGSLWCRQSQQSLQYVNSPFFIFLLTHYMFRPLRAIFRWDIQLDVSKDYSYNGSVVVRIVRGNI